MYRIKVGDEGKKMPKVPVSVPVVARPVDERYSILDVKQFQTNNPEDGLMVTEERYNRMLADTDLQEKIDAGIVVVEEVSDE